MAVHQKLSEIGWFYHAPEPNRPRDARDAPLASQIPGLNDLSQVPYDNEPRSLFRDTDTKYIRLAKMGGREDLLRPKEQKSKGDGPVSYPRNDWYYLEDNRMEAENADLKPWEFRLPEYMVHDEHKPYGEGYDYTNDPEGKIYWTKGRVPIGSRDMKFNRRQSAPTSYPEGDPDYQSASATRSHRPKQPAGPQMYDPSARPAMNKLLAYGYAGDWEKNRDAWYAEMNLAGGSDDMYHPSLPSAAAPEPKHRSAGAKSDKKPKTLTTWKDINKRNSTFPAKQAAAAPKKPFKLSKYEKVESKVNTQRILPPISH